MQCQESFKLKRKNPSGTFPSSNTNFIGIEKIFPPSTIQANPDDHPLTAREATRKQVLSKILSQDLPDRNQLARYIRRAFQKNLKLGSIIGSCRSNIQFLSYLRDEDSARLRHLSRSHIAGFVESQQDRGLNPSTINTQLANIYAFIRFVVEQGNASSDILVRKVAIQVPKPLPRDIPRDDEDLLLSIVDDTRDRAMILLLLRTGMRIQVARNFDTPKVDV